MDMAESQTMNPYAYGNNSPVTFSDPTGRAFCEDEACQIRSPAGGGGGGSGDDDDSGDDGDDSSHGGGGAVPPAPSKPTPSVSQEDVERARLLKQQSRMDAIKRIAMEVLKDASGYNDVVSCIGGDLGTCAMLALEAAVPWAGKAKRLVKALDRAWSAYNKWDEEVRWAVGVMRRADADAAAMAKYAEDMAAWRKQADAAKAAKKADETAAEAARKADSGGGGGGDGGSSCVSNSFTPETKVLLADGSTKAIKDLKPGDKVLATDPETGKTEPKTVDATIKGQGAKQLVKVTIDVDGAKGTKTSEVTATDGHPFWVPELREWIDATDLKAGQWLQTGAGTRVQVTALERWTAASTSVHNLTVGDFHTYYVLAGSTPVLVHNANCKVVVENQAGRFGDMDPGVPGDRLTPHHMPQDALGHLPRNDGGAIVMKHADHALTRTYGARGRATKVAEAGLPLRTVLARDIWDMRRIGQQQYGDPGYYNKGIQDLLAYYRSIGKL